MVLPTTTLPLIPKKKPEVQKELTAKQRCEARGGRWDGTKCILPEKEVTPEEVGKPIFKPGEVQAVPGERELRPEKPEPAGLTRAGALPGETPGGVFVSDVTGKPSGIELPDGRIFLGLSPDEVKEIQQREGLQDLPLISEKVAQRGELRDVLQEFKGEQLTPEQIEAQGLSQTELSRLQELSEKGGMRRTPEEEAEHQRLLERNRKFQAIRTEERELLSPENIEATLKSFGGGMLAGLTPAIMSVIATKAWSVKGITAKAYTSKRAVQVGTATKNTGAVTSLFSKVKGLGGKGLSVYAFFKLTEGLSEEAFSKKVPSQKGALNTLGQITSTIVGDSTSGAGDWRMGLKELKHLEQELYQLERAMKTGEINNAQLRISGELIDIQADIYDAIATNREGQRDIQTFALQGIFPELSENEIQQRLRELEREGYIEPVSLEEARRETSP